EGRSAARTCDATADCPRSSFPPRRRSSAAPSRAILRAYEPTLTQCFTTTTRAATVSRANGLPVEAARISHIDRVPGRAARETSTRTRRVRDVPGRRTFVVYRPDRTLLVTPVRDPPTAYHTRKTPRSPGARSRNRSGTLPSFTRRTT